MHRKAPLLKEGTAPLLLWYGANRRSFPWRETGDPYAIWISEVMLQQTQAARGVEYHRRWMHLFPTLRSLAEADESEVLKAWEGLGYYSRARNLLKAARLLRERGLENLPGSFGELLTLPGTGAYTAAAVASIAFGIPVPALDANGRRVFSRLLDLDLPADRTPGDRAIREAFASMIPPDRPGDFNSAVMELGATLCSPASVLCGECPLGFLCMAGKRGNALTLPVLSVQPKAERINGTMFVLLDDGEIFLRRRPPGGLWAGFEEFPWNAPPLEPENNIYESIPCAAENSLGIIRCSFTKWRLSLRLRVRRLRNSRASLPEGHGRWIGASELATIPLPAGSRKAREAIIASGIIPSLR